MFMFNYNYSSASVGIVVIMVATIIFGAVMLGYIIIQEIKDFFKNRIDKNR